MQIFLDEVGNEDLGIVLSKKPDIPTAQQSVITTMVPGSRHGSLTQFQGWQDVQLKCDFMIMPTLLPGLTGLQGYNEVLRRLNNWVMGSSKLVFSDDRGYYRIIKQVSIDAASPAEVELVGNVSVNLVLDPFWYQESDPIMLEHSDDVYNPGSQESEPLLTVFGSGTVKFSINGTELTLLKVTDYLTIDSWHDTVIHGSDSGIFDEQLDGEYPLLKPGLNEIELGQNATKIVIDGRWSWL